MSGSSHIHYFPHQQIDKEKWDHCISTADNGLIYGYSFYLDHMSAHWDALVLGDYEIVMPLTWNSKFGIRYLYQPFLAAQLGLFGKKITDEQVSSFIHAIPAPFRYIDISLNSKNLAGTPSKSTIRRTNYILDLDKPYETIAQNYRENIRRNIKKATQLGCTVEKDFAPGKVIELAVRQMKSQGHEEKENIERFSKLYQLLHAKQMALTYGIFSSQKELLASCIFFFSHNRAYYILVGNHPDSKTAGASHALIDAFIKDHAGKKMTTGQRGMVLDFEGSDIPSLALFYSSFGAVQEKYPALKINRLPFYLRWMKK